MTRMRRIRIDKTFQLPHIQSRVWDKAIIIASSVLAIAIIAFLS